MKKILLLFFLFLGGILAVGQDDPAWIIRYNNGLELKSADSRFQFKLGGRIQFDVMNIYQDDSLDAHFLAQNGAEFRRLRWYTSGTLFSNVKFKLQFDFSNGDAGVKDAYIEVVKIPVIGNFRVGHFKQPFGLEMQTSSNFITFMERGLTYIFTPERDLGFMVYNMHFNQRLAWHAGFFYPSGSVGKYLGNQYRYTFRLTGLPVYKTSGRYTVLHLGMAYENQFQDGQELRFSERPEAHLAPKYVDLKIDAVSSADAFGGELSFVSGPFALQGEVMVTGISPSPYSAALHNTYNYFAYYGFLSWFITGEHKNYSRSKAAFDRISPKKNLGKNGSGAWELVLRVSHIDLNNKDLNGGELTDFTFGLNWYLNPAARLMFNYIYADVPGQGSANIAMLRFAIAF